MEPGTNRPDLRLQLGYASGGPSEHGPNAICDFEGNDNVVALPVAIVAPTGNDRTLCKDLPGPFDVAVPITGPAKPGQLAPLTLLVNWDRDPISLVRDYAVVVTILVRDFSPHLSGL